jgi:hypothetical protein
MAKIPWNALVSTVINPTLERLAKKIAAGIPENSPMRGEFSRNAISFLTGLLEDYKAKGSGGVFFDKTADFFELLRKELGEDTKGGGFSFEKLSARWLGDFWAEAQKTLSQTSHDKLDEVRARIMKDFQIRQEIFQILCDAAKQLQPKKPAPQPIDWAAIDKKAAEWLQTNRPSWIRRRPKKGGSQ